jgi:hypothetical protein
MGLIELLEQLRATELSPLAPRYQPGWLTCATRKSAGSGTCSRRTSVWRRAAMAKDVSTQRRIDCANLAWAAAATVGCLRRLSRGLGLDACGLDDRVRRQHEKAFAQSERARVGGLCKVSPPAVLVRRQPFNSLVGQGCRMGCLPVITSVTCRQTWGIQMSSDALPTRCRRRRSACGEHLWARRRPVLGCAAAEGPALGLRASVLHAVSQCWPTRAMSAALQATASRQYRPARALTQRASTAQPACGAAHSRVTRAAPIATD